jgi:hypothetical protein
MGTVSPRRSIDLDLKGSAVFGDCDSPQFLTASHGRGSASDDSSSSGTERADDQQFDFGSRGFAAR